MKINKFTIFGCIILPAFALAVEQYADQEYILMSLWCIQMGLWIPALFSRKE